MSHLAVNVVSIHSGIEEEFLYDFRINIATWIQQLCPSSFLENFKYGSVLKSLQSNNPFHNDCCSFIAIIYAMSASMDLKLSEPVHGRLEDFLETKCLVEDICTYKHKAEEKKCKPQNTNTNLISVKLVHKHKHKILKRNRTVSNVHGIGAKTCNHH